MKFTWFCRICGRSGVSELDISVKNAEALHQAALESDKTRNPFGNPKFPRNHPQYELLGSTECEGDLRVTRTEATARGPKQPHADLPFDGAIEIK